MSQRSPLSEHYIDRLATRYPTEHVEQLAYDWRFADLPHQPNRQIPYIRLNQESSDLSPVLYVPGFTEGIVAKAPFAIELASQGLDVVLPDQNRRKMQRNSEGKKDATHSQALNYLSVLESEGLTDTRVHVVSHSYGSLIFDEMHRIAERRGWTSFDDSVAVLLAPAGSCVDESALRLGRRFLAMLRSEGAKSPKEFPDETGEMFRAGQRHALTNPLRLIREAWELRGKRVDYDRLATSNLAHVAILGYAEDVLYSHSTYEACMQQAVETGVSYATPVELGEWYEGIPRMGMHATHNDEQFNPARVANAVTQVLRLHHKP